MIDWQHLADKCLREHLLSERPAEAAAAKEPVDRVDYPLKNYIHAFKSIKRDFAGIPIMIAFQPNAGLWYADIVKDGFDNLVKKTPEQLKGYINDRWYFCNVHEHFRQSGFLNEEYFVGLVHMLNMGQREAARFLSQQLTPVIDQLAFAKR
jgi:hypothetical protein